MLREAVIYNPLQLCPSTALITAVPHGQGQGTLSHHSRTSMEIRVHGKSLPRVFLAAIYVGDEFGNAEFDLDFSSLCKCLFGSGSWQRKCGGQWAPGKEEPGGLQRGSWVTSGEKDCTQVELVIVFSFPVYPKLCLCVHFKQRECKSLHSC